MTTLVLSDLHLGRRDGRDLLRRPQLWEPLLARVAEAARVVLLGDVVELRHGPMGDALQAAQPFLRALGSALGPAGEVVVVPGNHDHRLIAGWHERRRALGAVPLGLEHRVPIHGDEPVGQLARWARPAALSVAYPGLWLRDDIYATHGHYLDVHTTVPTLERLAVGGLARIAGRLPAHPRVEHYEAALSPLYAAVHELAQRPRRRRRRSRRTGPGQRLAAALAPGRTDRPPRLTALGAAYPLAVRALEAGGLGPLRPVARPREIAAAGVAAMSQVCERLEIPAAHVVFGHVHRAGPLPGVDYPSVWITTSGVRLTNTGSWVLEPGLLSAERTCAYWPGTCVALAEDGSPEVVRVLADGAPDLAEWTGARRRHREELAA